MKTIIIDDIKYNLVPVSDSVAEEIETWVDTKTGLEWEVNGSKDQINFYEALTYAKNLGENWRVPTIEEMQTLIDRSTYDPACSDEVQENLSIKAYYYWMSTSYAPDTSNAWSVYFHNGSMSYDNKSLNYYVRCVRGGK